MFYFYFIFYVLLWTTAISTHTDFPVGGLCLLVMVCFWTLVLNAPFSIINISPFLPPCSFIKKSAKQASASPNHVRLGESVTLAGPQREDGFLLRACDGSSLLLFHAGALSETASKGPGMCLEWVAGISECECSPSLSHHFEVLSFCTSISFLPDPFQDADERSRLLSTCLTALL